MSRVTKEQLDTAMKAVRKAIEPLDDLSAIIMLLSHAIAETIVARNPAVGNHEWEEMFLAREIIQRGRRLSKIAKDEASDCEALLNQRRRPH